MAEPDLLKGSELTVGVELS